MLVGLIPAHNEAECITEAIRGLQEQTEGFDHIVVVADNCTDDTEVIAEAQGAEVYRTEGNRDKKAGALNQVLADLLPILDDEDYVLVTDADSVLDPTFIRNALRKLSDTRYGGVGGVFRGQPGGGFVGHLQRNEYARYARDVQRLNGKCLVITGTAALFRVKVLKEISAARGKTLPEGNGRGGVYDTTVLTEDNELSFALLHLGYKIVSPDGCTLTTEVMPTWRDLWKQRLRWKRGAVENCVQYGLTRHTWKYWGRQLFAMLGLLVTTVYLATVVSSLAQGSLHLHMFWLAISSVFVVERVVTVRHRGWKQMLFAVTMYELVLDYFLQACHAKAYIDAALRRNRNW